MSRTHFREARKRRDEGLLPIPLVYRRKHPRKGFRLDEWRSCPPSDQRLKAELSGYCNLGMLLGDESGGLAMRDFDTRPAYEWFRRRNPDLAAVLPTVRTHRGFNVYFLCTAKQVSSGSCGGSQIVFLEDGELRRQNWGVWPGSRHPHWMKYEWVIPPAPWFPFVADLVDAELLPLCAYRAGCHTGGNLPPAAPPEARGEADWRDRDCGIEPAFGWEGVTVAQAIRATSPTGPGERHHRIFEFARYLRALDETRDLDAKELHELVERWFRAALPYVRTKSFAVTWGEFTDAWNRVKVPYGGQINAIAAEARGTRIAWLSDFCRLLQRHHGPRPFFLGIDVAASLMRRHGAADVDRRTAARWLRKLREEGRIVLVERGRKCTGLASSFRYVGPA